MRSEIRERIEKIKKGEVPEGYKKTKVCIVPISWEVKKLDTIGTFLKGKGISKDEVVDNGIPCIRYGEIYTSYDCFIKESKSFISLETSQTSEKIFEGDLLFAGSGETLEDIGKSVAYINNREAYAGGDILILRPKKDNNNSLYFAYALNGDIFNVQRRKLGQGQSIVHIYSKDLKDILIPIPYEEEQRKIADILSTWDKAIELEEKLIEQKKEQKKSLMKKLFTGKKRIPGFDTRWHKVQLGDMFERVTRKNTVNNTNVLTISAQRGLINQEDFFSKLVASSILDNYYLLQKGEFAYNKSYSNGYPMGAIKRLNMYESGVVTTLYICFKLKNESDVDSDFFEQYFESGLLNYGLTQIAQEGGRAHGLLNVSPSDFFNITITIPGKNEQEAIAKILCTADKEINLHQQELDALKLQKKGLMQLLLTGIVRVNN